MRGICPNCEKETELEIIKGIEKIIVRNESIVVEVEYLKCIECHTEFRDPKSPDDPLDKAYKEFRRLHDMVNPEKIKEFREQYSLTQQELSNILGWGGATLSRYENGALQDEAHDTILKLIMEPKNFLELVEDKPNAINLEKRNKLIELLREYRGNLENSISKLYDNIFGKYDASKYSGYKQLNITKLFNLIIYLCMENYVPKTKLNKLIFYTDFKHFKEYTVSVTGARYAHLPFGPAPEHYQYYIATLHDDEKAIQIEEKVFPSYIGEYITSIKDPNLSIFSTTELKVLAIVKEHFADLNASEISKLSHEEIGYQSTRDGQLISYEYAKDLKV